MYEMRKLLLLLVLLITPEPIRFIISLFDVFVNKDWSKVSCSSPMSFVDSLLMLRYEGCIDLRWLISRISWFVFDIDDDLCFRPPRFPWCVTARMLLPDE